MLEVVSVTAPVCVFTEVTPELGKLVSPAPLPVKDVAVTLPALSKVTPVPLPLPSVISLAVPLTSALSVVFSRP